MFPSLFDVDIEWANELGTVWYRSRQPAPVKHPFVGGGYLANKKWPLIEGSSFRNRNF